MPRRAAEGTACCRRWSGAGRQPPAHCGRALQRWRRRQLHDHACGGVQRIGGERTRREAHEGRPATLNGIGSMGLVLCTTARTISACWRRRRRERCAPVYLLARLGPQKRLGCMVLLTSKSFSHGSKTIGVVSVHVPVRPACLLVCAVACRARRVVGTKWSFLRS